MSLEFGRKGPEGIKGEGVSETKGWSSLKNVPFAGNVGDEMLKQASEINELLESIELPDEDDKSTEKMNEADEAIKGLTSDKNTENIDDVDKEIEELKDNLHRIFG